MSVFHVRREARTKLGHMGWRVVHGPELLENGSVVLIKKCLGRRQWDVWIHRPQAKRMEHVGRFSSRVSALERVHITRLAQADYLTTNPSVRALWQAWRCDGAVQLAANSGSADTS